MSYVPMVFVIRGGIDESLHHGALVVADADGNRIAGAGSPGLVTFLRSSAKPFQAIPLLESGAAEQLGLTRAEIAVIIGSHNGEPRHVETVRSILRKIGLTEEHLMCGAHPPYHRPTAKALETAGKPATAVHNNCSGKHAGMLALARFRGFPTEGYFRREHPVQEEILGAMTSFAGVDAGDVPLAIDGCTVPTYALSLTAAARAYARLMDPAALPLARGEAARRAALAMRDHPEMIGGEGRLDTDLMRAAPGLVAKAGAEGFHAVGFVRDGRGYGLALKVADGNNDRGRTAILMRALEDLELVPGASLARLIEAHLPPVLDRRGNPVGSVEARFELARF